MAEEKKNRKGRVDIGVERVEILRYHEMPGNDGGNHRAEAA